MVELCGGEDCIFGVVLVAEVADKDEGAEYKLCPDCTFERKGVDMEAVTQHHIERGELDRLGCLQGVVQTGQALTASVMGMITLGLIKDESKAVEEWLENADPYLLDRYGRAFQPAYSPAEEKQRQEGFTDLVTGLLNLLSLENGTGGKLEFEESKLADWAHNFSLSCAMVLLQRRGLMVALTPELHILDSEYTRGPSEALQQLSVEDPETAAKVATRGMLAFIRGTSVGYQKFVVEGLKDQVVLGEEGGEA